MANEVKKQPMDVESILKINSPADRLGGPIDLVYRNESEGWAIVTIYWDNCPTLGIRWFLGTYGTPVSYNHPQWFVLPDGLHQAILNQLPISVKKRQTVVQFLSQDKIDDSRDSKSEITE
jgi:hypothetical protein